MERSESIKNLSKGLMDFHSKMGIINKESRNPFFKSKYASLSTILENIREPLLKSGLTFSQFPTGVNTLTTILIHPESGEFIQDSFSMTPAKQDPQGQGSLITYQRRYALSAVLGLNIGEDDDANSVSVVSNPSTHKVTN